MGQKVRTQSSERKEKEKRGTEGEKKNDNPVELLPKSSPADREHGRARGLWGFYATLIVHLCLGVFLCHHCFGVVFMKVRADYGMQGTL